MVFKLKPKLWEGASLDKKAAMERNHVLVNPDALKQERLGSATGHEHGEKK